MAKLTKKAKALAAAVDKEKLHGVDEALGLIKTHATAKFDESVEIAINLGVDPRHADQMVRGVCILPNGTGGSRHCARPSPDWERCAANGLSFWRPATR